MCLRQQQVPAQMTRLNVEAMTLSSLAQRLGSLLGLFEVCLEPGECVGLRGQIRPSQVQVSRCFLHFIHAPGKIRRARVV